MTASPHPSSQLILWLAPGVSNEGRSSPLLVLVPAVSWPWVPAWGSLEPPRRDGENAQKTRKNGEKMGEIQPKRCEGSSANQGSTGRAPALRRRRRRRPTTTCAGPPPPPRRCSRPGTSRRTATAPLKNGGDHSFGRRFGPSRNRPPVFWYHFLESWRQDGENSEKTRKNGAKMGEKWPNKKSVGSPTYS